MRVRFAAVALMLTAAGCSTATGPGASPPAELGTITFRLAVIGDFGSGDAAEGRVSSMLRDRDSTDGFDALVTTGDNIYPSGQRSGFDARWREPYGWVTRRGIEVIASLGNHDIVTDRGEPVMELLAMPSRWYARTVGDAEIFVLDANRPVNPRQIDWLETTLAASTAAWQIIVFHQPAFSCGPHGNTQDVIDAWLPILERGGADLVLNGHDHVYERFASRADVAYVVTGGGGAGLYAIARCASGTPRLLVGREVHHALVVSGNADRLRVRAISPRGSFDEVVLD